MPASVPNFNFLARLVSEIWRGSQNKSGSSWFPRRPLVDNFFLYRALVRVNAYKGAKFQLPSSVSYGDMEGSQNKSGRCWSPQTPPSGQILYVDIVPANACQQPNFNFLARLVSEIWGGLKIKSGSTWFPQTSPSGQFLYRALVRLNAYKCAKFQLPSSNSYGDVKGVPK